MNCTECGQPIDPGSAFCTNCGAKVAVAAAPAAGAPASALVSGPSGAVVRRERPMGIVVTVIMTALNGLTWVGLSFLFLMIGSGVEALRSELGAREQVTFGVLLVGLVGYLWGIFFLAAAYGLAAFERWALSLARVVWALNILATIVVVAGDFNGATAVLGLFSVGVTVWILLYLSKPEVQALYSPR